MNGPDKIRAAGWRQGSVIERKSASDRLQKELEGIDPELTHWLVLTQDCDLVNPSYEKEPEIELLGCRVIQAVNGNFTHGKNPRRIHLPGVLPDKGAVLEASVFHRRSLPRDLLEEFAPAAGHALPQESVRQLIEWVARRYTRSAFPDEFNQRSRKTQTGMKKVLTDNGAVVSGVWLALNTYAELSGADKYHIGVRVVMSVADYGDAAKRDKASRVASALELAFADCAGIEVAQADLISEANFSLADLNGFIRFDPYDYLSNIEDE